MHGGPAEPWKALLHPMWGSCSRDVAQHFMSKFTTTQEVKSATTTLLLKKMQTEGEHMQQSPNSISQEPERSVACPLSGYRCLLSKDHLNWARSCSPSGSGCREQDSSSAAELGAAGLLCF